MFEPELKILYSQDTIATQVKRLAAEINTDFAGEDILMICVLKGSFLFFADLVREITIPVVVDFVRLASYGSETQSSGIVEIRKDVEMSLKNKNVIIVEDNFNGLACSSWANKFNKAEVPVLGKPVSNNGLLIFSSRISGCKAKDFSIRKRADNKSTKRLRFFLSPFSLKPLAL